MKKLVIFDTYPAGHKEISILNKAIESFKHPDWDMMVVSHLPLDQSTAKKVEYVIYDSNNTFLPTQITPFWWMESPSFNVKVFNGGHSLPICRNMNTSLQLAKALGYEHFIFTESDVVMHPEDLQRLYGYVDDMISQDKKMVFFKPDEYRDCGSYVYETLLFAGNVNFFLDVFVPPMDVKQWYDVEMGYSLELSFYEKFSSREDEYFIINTHSSLLFNKSDVNLLRYGLFNCQMIYNETYPDEPALFVINSLILDECRVIDVYRNGKMVASPYLCKDAYWFDTYKIDGSEITINVYNEDRTYLYFSKSYVLSEENDFKTKGVIKFN